MNDPKRMTPERLAVIRRMWPYQALDDLFTEIRELTRERDEYRREWESACERDRAANYLREQAERERDEALEVIARFAAEAAINAPHSGSYSGMNMISRREGKIG
jgi:hypothetical protein